MPKKSSSSKNTIPDALLLKLVNEKGNPLKQMSGYDPETDCLRAQINGLLVSIKHFTWSTLTSEQKDWIVDLTEKNMKQYYVQSAWGWSRQSKESEFKHKLSRHLIVTNQADGQPIACVHFKFEPGYEQDASLYCYELQVEEAYWRRGLGKRMMELLLSMASVNRMKKVLLTVLKSNRPAMDFYVKSLGFKVDKHSPSVCGEKEVDYEILSRKPVDLWKHSDQV